MLDVYRLAAILLVHGDYDPIIKIVLDDFLDPDSRAVLASRHPREKHLNIIPDLESAPVSKKRLCCDHLRH